MDDQRERRRRERYARIREYDHRLYERCVQVASLAVCRSADMSDYALAAQVEDSVICLVLDALERARDEAIKELDSTPPRGGK